MRLLGSTRNDIEPSSNVKRHTRRPTTNSPREATLQKKLISLFVTVFFCASTNGGDAIQGLRIERAVYSVQDGTIPCEVTTKVASICNGHMKCSVLAGNSLCPMGDPAPDSPKILAVAYRCGTTTLHRASTPEGQELFLTCKQ